MLRIANYCAVVYSLVVAVYFQRKPGANLRRHIQANRITIVIAWSFHLVLFTRKEL